MHFSPCGLLAWLSVSAQHPKLASAFIALPLRDFSSVRSSPNGSYHAFPNTPKYESKVWTVSKGATATINRGFEFGAEHLMHI